MNLFFITRYTIYRRFIKFFPSRPEKKGGGEEKRESTFDPQKVKHS